MFVVANWKMNLDLQQGTALAGAILQSLPPDGSVRVVICPSFLFLPQFSETFAGSRLELGAQDVFWQDSGAFTGEISPLMLRSAGCRFVIVGHSERRGRFGIAGLDEGFEGYFSDSDAVVCKKFWASLSSGLTPILCVGETLEERQAGQTDAVIDAQLGAVFGSHHLGQQRFLIAYEPVWAIGTGQVCDDAEANRVCSHIRVRVSGRGWADDEQFEVLYGGSVNASNAAALFAQPAIAGGLVGGASLKAEEFLLIVEEAEKAYVGK